MAGGVAAAAGGLIGLELCIPSLLLCWFCCWSDTASESSSTEGRPPKQPTITSEVLRGGCRGSSGQFRERTASGTRSLRLSSHSHGSSSVGHRSHEELGGAGGGAGSAPSVLCEVLHRRDWDTHTHASHTDFTIIPLTDTLRLSNDLEAATTSKTHNKTESSKKLSKEHSRDQELKDFEESPTYIDDNGDSLNEPTFNEILSDDKPNLDENLIPDEDYGTGINNDILITKPTNKTQFKAKEAKQSYNESIKQSHSMKVKRTSEIYENEPRTLTLVENVEVSLDRMECSGMNEDVDMHVDVDAISLRSGAMHHASKDSLTICHSKLDYPRASVEAVSYSVAACYLQQAPAGTADVPAVSVLPAVSDVSAGRGRLASDPDILDTSRRPHSAAFSESDLELELEISASIERPPPYCHTTHTRATHDTTRRKETAI